MVLVLAACSSAVHLSQPPDLYLDGRNYPSGLMPLTLQVVEAPIFHVTDREPLNVPGGGTRYGTGRSDAMAFGQAEIRFGAADWQDQVRRTHVDQGGQISKLSVTQIGELVRFSDIPLPASRRDGGLRVLPDAARAYAARTDAFQDAVRAEVKRTGNGRILVYVHGINNDFDDSVQTLASLWHFTGRRSTPISFTWPAGNGGPLGHFQDREAGDFSVYHAREFLRMLAEIPEVEDMDFVAHSRGTSAMTQTLRERVIFNRARGVASKLAMNTGTLILAASDIDVGIVHQRLGAECL